MKHTPDGYSSQQCSILLLAGGRGSRMGGKDKGWVHWNGLPLIEHMANVVRPLTTDLIISCNRNCERYATLADQVVSDSVEGYPGPLIGIIEALKIAKKNQLLVLPCDAPKIDKELLLSLVKHAGSQPVLLHHQGHWQPLFSLIPTNLLANLEHQWNLGQRSPLRALLELQPKKIVIDSNDTRLDNFNDPTKLI